MKFFTIFILLSFSAYGEDAACLYPDVSTYELEEEKDCGVISSQGVLQIKNRVLDKIRWSQYGLVCAFVIGEKDNRGWFYINQNGLGRETPFWQDNDCAPFKSGLAVGLIDDKVVFFNQIIKVTKTTDYTWASGFNKGFSKVCKGDLDKVFDESGEHFHYTGGICGFIDESFKTIIPVQYEYENTPKPENP